MAKFCLQLSSKSINIKHAVRARNRKPSKTTKATTPSNNNKKPSNKTVTKKPQNNKKKQQTTNTKQLQSLIKNHIFTINKLDKVNEINNKIIRALIKIKTITPETTISYVITSNSNNATGAVSFKTDLVFVNYNHPQKSIVDFIESIDKRVFVKATNSGIGEGSLSLTLDYKV